MQPLLRRRPVERWNYDQTLTALLIISIVLPASTSLWFSDVCSLGGFVLFPSDFPYFCSSVTSFYYFLVLFLAYSVKIT